jgi:hypothetical protein
MGYFQIFLSIVGVIGTGLAIYQWAVINEAKKRKEELQFLLASIHQTAISKQLEWNNQINLLPPLQNEKDLEVLRVHTRARDSFMDIASSITALEGVIDASSSAITSMLQKNIEQSKLNNQLQDVGLKNPMLPKKQNLGEAQLQNTPDDVNNSNA